MEQRRPLVIYDAEGTIYGPVAYARARCRQEGTTHLSLEEFKKQNPGGKAMLPGMLDLMEYTAIFSNNVLVSEGDPLNAGCKQLVENRHLFQNWRFDEDHVEWGRVPNNLSKAHRSVVRELLKTFEPNQVAVIGDSTSDYIMAFHFFVLMQQEFHIPSSPPPVLFFKMLSADEGVSDAPDGKPPVFFVRSGMQIKEKLDEFWGIKSNSKESHFSDVPTGSQHILNNGGAEM